MTISKHNFAIIMASLAVFVGISDMLGGYDRYIYGQLFDISADSIRAGDSVHSAIVLTHFKGEPGYAALNFIIGLFSRNRYIFIFLSSLLIYWMFYKGFVRETKNYGYALLLFMGLYFFFTFTYLRQAIAVGCCFISYRYIVDRKLFKYLLCVFIAISFHNSAIIFLPMYFFYKKVFSPFFYISLAAICLLLGLSEIPSALFEIYGEAADNAERAVEYGAEDTSGFRLAYFLEAIVFLTIMLYNYCNINSTRRDIVQYNIAYAFCCILLIFCNSENGGRLSWFFLPGLICCITKLVNKPSIRSAQAFGIVILSFLLYVRILFLWGVLLSPYKTFFTPGYRQNDFIYRGYEYDPAYSNDKFYR